MRLESGTSPFGNDQHSNTMPLIGALDGISLCGPLETSSVNDDLHIDRITAAAAAAAAAAAGDIEHATVAELHLKSC